KVILDLVKPLYREKYHDGDSIYEYCKRFRSQVKLRKVLENIDIHNIDNYNNYSKQISKAIQDEDEKDEIQSSFLLRDVKRRQRDRQANTDIFPTPFRQVNELTNAGGYEA